MSPATLKRALRRRRRSWKFIDELRPSRAVTIGEGLPARKAMQQAWEIEDTEEEIHEAWGELQYELNELCMDLGTGRIPMLRELTRLLRARRDGAEIIVLPHN